VRPIDADKIGLTDFEIFMCQGDFKAGLQMLLQKIDNAPTLDIEPRWISVKDKLPEDHRMVVVTWINCNPVPYYAHIKNKPFVGSAHYHRGKWYWYSSISQDMLDEYGEWDADEISKDIEITAWANIEPYEIVKEQGV
jgi:hypothetical protein